jgi:hypothetical protein
MLLGLEDVERAEADRAAETDGSSPEDRRVRAHKRRINRSTAERCRGICHGLRSSSTSTTRASAADDRPWGGSDPPGVAYVYARDRKAERPIAHLEGFRGILQGDGYAG